MNTSAERSSSSKSAISLPFSSYERRTMCWKTESKRSSLKAFVSSRERWAARSTFLSCAFRPLFFDRLEFSESKRRPSTDSSFFDAMYAAIRRNFVSFGMSKSKAFAMLFAPPTVVACASSKTASPVK